MYKFIYSDSNKVRRCVYLIGQALVNLGIAVHSDLSVLFCSGKPLCLLLWSIDGDSVEGLHQ